MLEKIICDLQYYVQYKFSQAYNTATASSPLSSGRIAAPPSHRVVSSPDSSRIDSPNALLEQPAQLLPARLSLHRELDLKTQSGESELQ